MFAQSISLMLEPFVPADLDYRRERMMRQHPRNGAQDGTALAFACAEWSRTKNGRVGRSRLRLPRLRNLPWPRRRARQHTAIA
ncbi:MAG: hypothetical protein ACRDPB_09450 [Nocardioidaceae bacterium]